MKLTNNSTPKPQNWIWRVFLARKENDRLLDQMAAFSGVRLKHGEYRFVIKNGKICAHKTIVTSVVEVEEKEANNASENKEPINESAE